MRTGGCLLTIFLLAAERRRDTGGEEPLPTALNIGINVPLARNLSMSLGYSHVIDLEDSTLDAPAFGEEAGILKLGIEF